MKVRHVVAIAVALGVVLLPSAASASTGWQISPTPANPGGGSEGAYGSLAAISCITASACTAVGGDGAAGFGPVFTLAEHWNGTSWTIQPTPNPTGAANAQLSALKCVTSTFCMALGTYTDSSGLDHPFAESWNGTSWTAQALPPVTGALDPVLSAVACTTVTNCIAVGTTGSKPLAERWNGTSWKVQSTPATAVYSAFFGVSCTSASACTAVGYQNATDTQSAPLAERWNGTSWKIQSTPIAASNQLNRLNAVKCTSSTVCIAVGFASSATLAERWNGTSWKILSTPTPGSLAQFSAISCTAATSCYAVGNYDNGSSATLAEHWNGTSWAVQSTPNVALDPFDYLFGIACTSATGCMAVGEAQSDSGNTTLTLAERRT